MDDLEKKYAILERHFQRERSARKEAERLLEDRGRELYDALQSLKRAYEDQESIIENRTSELKVARDEALAANKAKSQFLSSMSHELRTPLNAILGFSQLILMDVEDEYQKENIEEIESAGQHLLNLINEVLDLSKIEAGNMTLSIEHVDMANLLPECYSLTRPIAERFGIELSFDEIENLFVIADYTRLKQVIINLVSNAIKYNRKNGTVSVEIQITDDAAVRVSVRDTGNGIPEDMREELFEPFKRLGAEKSNIEGTGIGLMITSQLVEMMGGRLGLESEVGVGSVFWVDMPMHESDNLQ